ncbi:CLUMA_CG021139, isoform A [Clunio marinus]|uniref:CLUMA_CG021139, isoform A n=1 Tax=Clunio marinus TaxID=568069 RepID=A0A1J1J6U2_9DIPT|nr:CLUMA_CG021139, isoform A [Clunio marinus]
MPYKCYVAIRLDWSICSQQHPLKMKLNVAINLWKRMQCLTTTDEDFRFLFKRLLFENNFPKPLTNRIINNNNNTQIHNNPPTVDVVFRPMVYIEGLSNRIKKIINKKIPNVKFGFKPQNRVKQFFTNLKDKIAKKEKRNLIYQIDCQCNKSYVGQTTQMLHKRLITIYEICHNRMLFNNSMLSECIIFLYELGDSRRKPNNFVYM